MCASETMHHSPWHYKKRFEIQFAQFHLREPFSSPVPFNSSREDGLLYVTPGRIRCRTGARVEAVDLTVEIRREAPEEVRDDYEDIVEVSYESTRGELSIFSPSERLIRELPTLPKRAGTYRLRYHMREMTRGSRSGGSNDDTLCECLLQIWPAPQGGIRELKITSAAGKFWHPTEMLLAPLIEAGLISREGTPGPEER
ncbi:hypothetical protein [Amycolatopsis sp. NPDC049868]|uniref:hypothetical protein n=1 Tax=Amycolatopsis sp. NPDC049868 TaxID=3363934 RepID=UPI003788E6EF